jgi:hypothetical protein
MDNNLNNPYNDLNKPVTVNMKHFKFLTPSTDDFLNNKITFVTDKISLFS